MDQGARGGGSSRGAEVCSVHSSKAHQGRISVNSNPRSSASSAMRRQRQQHPQSKFDFYMPLCEVQQGLKRGEIIEGILRVNPRNYEDSYISAPDGLMDIYIKGIRDRNRALNGDVVAVKLKPPQHWKILWDVITDYEDRQGQSIFSSDCLNSNSNNITEAAAAVLPNLDDSEGWTNSISNCNTVTEPAATALPCRNKVEGWASGWLVSESQRTADSLEILGLDQLQAQFQLFKKEAEEKEAKKKKSRNRSKKNRALQKQERELQQHQQNSNEQPISILDSSGSDPKVDNNNSAAAFQTSDESTLVDGHIVVDDFSTNNTLLDFSTRPDQILEPSEVNSSLNSNCEIVSTSIPSDQIASADLQASCAASKDNAGNLPLSSSEEELFPLSKAVAPDELSGEEFSNSVSGDSVGSQQRDQDLEDAEFFAEHQDACNNNEPSENFPVELNLNGPLDPALEIQNLIDQTRQLSVMQGFGTSPDVKSEEKVLEPFMQSPEGDVTDCSAPVTDVISSQVSVTPETVDAVAEDQENTGGKAKKRNRGKKKRKHGKKNVEETAKRQSPSEDKSSQEQDIPQIQKKQMHQVNKTSTPQPKAQVTPQKPSNCTPRKNNNSASNLVPYPNATVTDILKLPNHNMFLQKTGQVVYIIEKKHSRAAMGYIKKQQDNNPYWAMFSPTDHRLPRILIPMVDCPKNFYERPEDFKTSLFIAMIKEWDENSTFAKGRLARSLGEAGEIEPETEGILIENDITTSDFSEECLKSLPHLPWQMPEEELEKRRDFRKQCVFTIDPKTARDLDDAISVCEIEDGLLEVGVHIADVSFFLHENTALDVEASHRSTSVYLVQKVVPMLPRVLCEDLCSLNPGEDKLTFSVVWKITPEGDIMDEWFGKTIIHSCTKFSYEHAQDLIDNGEREWGPDELPEIHDPFGPLDVLWCVQKLQTLGVNLRKKRFNEGALKLDQIKIQFTLNNDTGMPSGFSIYEQMDSHRLIEELMLLANMAVAHKIYKAFPEKAFLRCHPPPQTKMVNDLVETCATLGIHLDPSSAGSLQASLARYTGNDPLSLARTLVLTHLCSKPMRPARYYCAGWTSGPEDFHHYALNVPLYTHFTSPIRRYPDVIVHRFLAASLELGQPPSQNALALQKLSVHCNDKKYTAKRVHELSCDLFLGCFIRQVGPLEEAAVVVDVMDHSFDVLISRMGVIKRVYCDKLSVAAASYEKNLGIPKLTLTWTSEGVTQVQQITMFTLVQVVISSIPKEPMKLNVIIKPPKFQPAV